MSDFDFTSIPKIVLILSVIILYLSVSIAILKSICKKRGSHSPYHVEFINTEKYKGMEKRRTERFSVKINALLYNESRSIQHSAKIEDISSLGIRCKIENPPIDFVKGDSVFIEISEKENMSNFKIPCKLVWKKGKSESLRYGAEFLENNAALENYLLFLKKEKTRTCN